MSEFTASNGITVQVSGLGNATVGDPTPVRLNENSTRIAHTSYLDQIQVAGLREFFQHEHDEEFGRWRWPDDPRFVVYPSSLFRYPEDPDLVEVVNERNGQSHRARRGDSDGLFGLFSGAARAYFDAHSQSKPWHDAKPGEVWTIGVGGGYHCDSASVVQTGAGVRFFWGVKGGGIRDIAINDPSIDYGHRIWPEEAA